MNTKEAPIEADCSILQQLTIGAFYYFHTIRTNLLHPAIVLHVAHYS